MGDSCRSIVYGFWKHGYLREKASERNRSEWCASLERVRSENVCAYGRTRYNAGYVHTVSKGDKNLHKQHDEKSRTAPRLTRAVLRFSHMIISRGDLATRKTIEASSTRTACRSTAPITLVYDAFGTYSSSLPPRHGPYCRLYV